MKKILLIFIILLFSSIVNAGPLQCDPLNEMGVVMETVSWANGEILGVQRAQTLTTEVELTATKDLENVEVNAFILGHDRPISEKSEIFDIDANVTTRLEFYIKLPKNIEEDYYKIRYIISDRYHEAVTCYANYRITKERHNVELKDVLFQDKVKSGSAFLVKSHLKNYGAKDEQSIKLSVSLPELKVKESTYIDMLESEETATEELFLRVPRCTISDTYLLKVHVEYDESTITIDKLFNLKIDGEDCPTNTKIQEEKEIVIFRGPELILANTAALTLVSEGPSLRNIFGGSLIVLVIVLAMLLFALAVKRPKKQLL